MAYFTYYEIEFNDEKNARQRWVDNGFERFPFTDYEIMVKDFVWSERQNIFYENFDPKTCAPYADGETRHNMVGRFRENYHMVTFVLRGERTLRIITGHRITAIQSLLGPKTDMPQAAFGRRAKVNLARAVITIAPTTILGYKNKP